MKVLVYRNKSKDPDNCYSNIVVSELNNFNIDYELIDDDNLDSMISADVLIVIGGDGTILDVANFANKNDIPILGINAGTVGFLTEFENFEICEAISLLNQGKLVKDFRATIIAEFKGKKYLALNEVVVQRIFAQNQDGHITTLEVSINDNIVDNIAGDGVIVCSATGSTAYSLSASGAILTPDINAFMITPICAHSLHHRPIIFSADSTCTIQMLRGNSSGLVIDGKFFETVNVDDVVVVKKSNKQTVFLRRPNSNFFNTLIKKLNRKVVKNV